MKDEKVKYFNEKQLLKKTYKSNKTVKAKLQN